MLNDNEPSGLKDLDPYSIYLVGIIASDDSNDHGIAICNDWIFDANVPMRSHIAKTGWITQHATRWNVPGFIKFVVDYD